MRSRTYIHTHIPAKGTPRIMHLCNTARLYYLTSRALHSLRKVLLPHRQMRVVYFTAAGMLFSNNDPIATGLEILHLITHK
jgi:hypothetical protein